MIMGVLKVVGCLRLNGLKIELDQSLYYRGPQRRYLFTVAQPNVYSAKALPLCHTRMEYFDVFQVLY